MGTHPVPSVLQKAARRVDAHQPPSQLPHGRPHGCGPVAAAVTLQLDTASPHPVTSPGTMGSSCNPHLTCHMAGAQAAAVAPLLDAASPRPVTNLGTMGGAAPVLQAPQHSFSGAASTAALLLSCCKYCSSPSLPHGSSPGAPAAALQLDAVSPRPVTNPETMGGCCLPLHPPHGRAQGRRAVHRQPASQMRCARAQANRRTSKKAQAGHPALGTKTGPCHSMAVRQGGWAPGLTASYFGPHPLVFPTPRLSHRTAGPPRAQKPHALRAKPLSQVAVPVCSQVPRGR